MSTQAQYNRVRVHNPKDEIKMISVLRDMGQPFKAVSKTDYIVSKKQCAVLKSKNVPYEILK